MPGHGLSTLQIFDAYNKFRAPHPGLRRFPDGVELADLPSLAAAMLDCGLDPQPFFAALMDQAESAGRRLHDQTHKEP